MTADSYIAHASVRAGSPPREMMAAYKIEVRFLGGLSGAQKNAFKAAADRWCSVIVGDVPSVVLDGEVIDDLLILAQGVSIDGPDGILGQAGPTHLRPASAGASAFLPAKGTMSFDSADLTLMETDGTLLDVIAHEMGHVLGVGTLWTHKGLLGGERTARPVFKGSNAKRECGLLNRTGPTLVPVENTGGPGTKNCHWRETVFGNELMSGFIDGVNSPLSRVTAASLQDLGYIVDLGSAEPYVLPEVRRGASAGARPRPHSLPTIPMILPRESLQRGTTRPR